MYWKEICALHRLNMNKTELLKYIEKLSDGCTFKFNEDGNTIQIKTPPIPDVKLFPTTNTEGCFETGLTEQLCRKLWNGDVLKYEHSVYGIYYVYMNMQRNRVLVKPLGIRSNITEDNIFSFMLLHRGQWWQVLDQAIIDSFFV